MPEEDAVSKQDAPVSLCQVGVKGRGLLEVLQDGLADTDTAVRTGSHQQPPHNILHRPCVCLPQGSQNHHQTGCRCAALCSHLGVKKYSILLK